jgi:hypothetical protein
MALGTLPGEDRDDLAATRLEPRALQIREACGDVAEDFLHLLVQLEEASARRIERSSGGMI